MGLYYETFDEVRNYFLSLVDPLIERFDSGEFTDSLPKETRVEKIIKWVHNNPVLSPIYLVVAFLLWILPLVTLIIMLHTGNTASNIGQVPAPTIHDTVLVHDTVPIY